jgi:DNA-binding transcriptional MerR regulator
MRIGEVARRSGVSVRMLRHHDSLGLVSPSDRTSAGYREYTEKDLRRILHVEALRSLGLSLAQAGDALDAVVPGSPDPRSPDRHDPNTDDADPDVSPPHEPAQVLDALIARTRDRLAAEQELLTRLEDTRDRAPQDWDDVLGTIALLRAVRSDDPGSRHAVALTGHDVPPAALARAALDEDETNIAGALRWAARRDPDGGAAVVQAAARALAGPDPTRRHRAVELLADQLPPDGSAQPQPDATAASGPGHSGPSHSGPGHSAPGDHAIVTLVTTGLTDDDAEVRATSALALASVPGQLDGSQRQTLTDVLLDLIVDGENDVEAAEGLGRLATAEQTTPPASAQTTASMTSRPTRSATEQPTPATASAAAEALLARLQDPEVTAAGRLLQAAGELPDADLRHVLDAHAQTTDPEAARILAYLEHRLDAGTQP